LRESECHSAFVCGNPVFIGWDIFPRHWALKDVFVFWSLPDAKAMAYMRFYFFYELTAKRNRVPISSKKGTFFVSINMAIPIHCDPVKMWTYFFPVDWAL
jgi:hypothetical protein